MSYRQKHSQQPHTCLKLSNADKIIWWPPLTRQMAASSSSTNVLVLCDKHQAWNSLPC